MTAVRRTAVASAQGSAPGWVVLLLCARTLFPAPATAIESPADSTAARILDALGTVRTSTARDADPSGSPREARDPAPRVEATVPAVVLREVRTSNMELHADTLITLIADGRMRVTHGDVHSILDVTGDRFILLEPEAATYRSVSFADWEREIRRSPVGEGRSETLRFESMGGKRSAIAGFGCERYHLYARREVFPGEFEEVEQEIWLTRELALPAGAAEAYARVQRDLDWIAMDAPVERPEGVALRTSLRRRPEGGAAGRDEVEIVEVISVERLDVPAAWFEIPGGYVRAQADPLEGQSSPGAADSSRRR